MGAMRSRLLIFLIALVAACCATVSPASAAETGVNETLGQTVDSAERAPALGADWVRVWALWQDLEQQPGVYTEHLIADLDQRVAALKARGVKVLVVVHRAPPWATAQRSAIAPPADPATFAAFMRTIAQRVPGADAWELWNEQDGSEFWLGGPDPAAYAALLKAAYPAIKAVQPGDTVVTGGLVGNDMDFVEALYAHGAKGSFDAVGVHTDTACLVDGPDFNYRDERGRIARYTFSAFREVHAVMSAHGDGAKRIWMTELGWNTQSTAPGSCSTGMWAGQKPMGVSEAQQAEFLTQAYRCLAADPIVGVALWFGMQDIPGSGHAAGYGLYRADGSPKPSAAAFRGLAGGIEPQPCGGMIDTSGPAIQVAQPLDGLKFVDMFDVDAKAVDTGGIGIRRLEFYADGKFVRSFGDGVADISPWWDSRYWKRGKHTLTFKAEDEAGNKAAKTITVYKVRKLPKVRTAAALALEQLAPGTVRVTGGVTRGTAHAATRLRGKAFVVFQKRAGRRWKTVHKIRTRAGRPVSVTKTVKAGRWRVFLNYPGVKGFKKSRSKPVRFRVV